MLQLGSLFHPLLTGKPKPKPIQAQGGHKLCRTASAPQVFINRAGMDSVPGPGSGVLIPSPCSAGAGIMAAGVGSNGGSRGYPRLMDSWAPGASVTSDATDANGSAASSGSVIRRHAGKVGGCWVGAVMYKGGL